MKYILNTGTLVLFYILFVSLVIIDGKEKKALNQNRKVSEINDSIYLKVELDIKYYPELKEKVAMVNYVIINGSNSILLFNTLTVFGIEDMYFFKVVTEERQYRKVYDHCASICHCEEYERKPLNRKDTLNSIITIKPFSTYKGRLKIYYCKSPSLSEASYYTHGMEENVTIQLKYDNTHDNNPYLYKVKKVWKGKLESNMVTF